VHTCCSAAIIAKVDAAWLGDGNNVTTSAIAAAVGVDESAIVQLVWPLVSPTPPPVTGDRLLSSSSTDSLVSFVVSVSPFDEGISTENILGQLSEPDFSWLHPLEVKRVPRESYVLCVCGVFFLGGGEESLSPKRKMLLPQLFVAQRTRIPQPAYVWALQVTVESQGRGVLQKEVCAPAPSIGDQSAGTAGVRLVSPAPHLAALGRGSVAQTAQCETCSAPYVYRTIFIGTLGYLCRATTALSSRQQRHSCIGGSSRQMWTVVVVVAQ
jgi:hypothetical protein